MLADLESLEKRVTNLEKRAKGGDKESATSLRLVNLALTELNAGPAGAPTPRSPRTTRRPGAR